MITPGNSQRQPIPPHAKRVFQGIIFDIYQWQQEMYDGTVKTFEKIKRPSAVVVYPILDSGNILLTEQEQPLRGRYVSAPAGRIDPGEEPLSAAKRELFEETGYQAHEWVLWKTIYPSIKTDYAVYYYIAKKCHKAAEQQLDGGERVDLREVSFDEFLQTMRRELFAEKEVVAEIYEALLDSEKYQELKNLFRHKSNH